MVAEINSYLIILVSISAALAEYSFQTNIW
jgi:hypothetical protein